jgi:hypothetical protein
MQDAEPRRASRDHQRIPEEAHMPRVIATHRVGNMDTWLRGGEERAQIFKQFSSGYRIYRHPSENKVALVWENADLGKLEAALSHPDTEKAKAKHTVQEPIDIYVEVEGGR